MKKYILDSQDKITAILEDGTEITGIDEIQVGTGYRPFPSFIHVLDAATKQALSLMSSGITPHRVPSLHRLILYAPNPSLAFIGTAAISFTPFTIADVTSAWLTLAWLGEIEYPDTPALRLQSEIERLEAVENFRAQTDNPSSLFTYGVLGDSEEAYAAGIKADIVKARPELQDVLPEWNAERTKEREKMPIVKRQTLEFFRSKSSLS